MLLVQDLNLLFRVYICVKLKTEQSSWLFKSCSTVKVHILVNVLLQICCVMIVFKIVYYAIFDEKRSWNCHSYIKSFWQKFALGCKSFNKAKSNCAIIVLGKSFVLAPSSFRFNLVFFYEKYDPWYGVSQLAEVLTSY